MGVGGDDNVGVGQRGLLSRTMTIHEPTYAGVIAWCERGLNEIHFWEVAQVDIECPVLKLLSGKGQ